MRRQVAADREYWNDVLLAGGFTPIPRWTRHPSPGIEEHQEPIGAELGAALADLAEASGVPLSTVVLTAHARVLAAITGESEVATGYQVPDASQPVPCRWFW